jgi:hypothetical protein
MLALVFISGVRAADIPASTDAQLSMTLALVPAEVLPGLPVSFRVTLTNSTNLLVDVPQALR